MGTIPFNYKDSGVVVIWEHAVLWVYGCFLASERALKTVCVPASVEGTLGAGSLFLT